LTSLLLSGNDVVDAGIEALAFSFTHTHTHSHTYTHTHTHTHTHAHTHSRTHTHAHALQASNSALTSLVLSGNDVGDAGVEALCTSLTTCTTLLRLLMCDIVLR